MKDKEWIDKYLNGKTWSYYDLITSGRANLDDLEDGDFKDIIKTFLNADSDISSILETNGYEAG